MSPSSSSHFLSFFPLVIDSVTYGVYSVLFFQSIHILYTHKKKNFKFNLGCMIALFLLSTVHIALAWTWAFITDSAQTAIYEVYSLDKPLPILFLPDDPPSTHRIATLIKVRYALANALADLILIHRCYVIWGFNWRPVAIPALAYVCTLIGGILGNIPLSGPSQRAAVAVCIGTTFSTNVLASGLAAGRIWWISRRAATLLGRKSRMKMKYWDLTAILVESGVIYPAGLLITIALFLSPATPTVSVLISIGAVYHLVGIAPTLIIVRVGLGVSTDDVDKCVTITNSRLPTRGRGTNPTTVLEFQAHGMTSTEMDDRSNDSTKFP
ncbi:hypothetical protein B0H17DRAFT_1098795 [Mycena rosella]|uniref:Uncharacterized protein n=1 Tax=Mycena rosella TaxID=1033263 RepID=A0AAD7G0W8_MYCRO|nr:hypothetical protein B0H17DRAFT_1098795 [Mycena rosella]